MSLCGLGKLIRHYLKLVIALPVACALVAWLVFTVMPSTYQATATLVTNADLAIASGYAQNEASRYSQNGIEVTFSAVSSTQSIVLTSEGKDYGGCIAAVNATVLAVGDDIHALDSETLVDINEATIAINISQSSIKMAMLAFFIGLFIALCIVIILDMVKSSIKSRTDIEESSGLCVLGEIPARDKGERLLANIRFVAGKTPSTIAIIPVGGSGGAITCAELTNVLAHSGVRANRVKAEAHAQGLKVDQSAGITTVIECKPLSEGMGAAYISRDAELTVLCATEWLDSRKALKNVVEELNLAKAKIGGVVFLVDGKPKGSF